MTRKFSDAFEESLNNFNFEHRDKSMLLFMIKLTDSFKWDKALSFLSEGCNLMNSMPLLTGAVIIDTAGHLGLPLGCEYACRNGRAPH